MVTFSGIVWLLALCAIALGPLLGAALLAAILLGRAQTRRSFIAGSVGWGALLAAVGLVGHYAVLARQFDDVGRAGWALGKLLGPMAVRLLLEATPVAIDLLLFGVGIMLTSRWLVRRFVEASAAGARPT